MKPLPRKHLKYFQNLFQFCFLLGFTSCSLPLGEQDLGLGYHSINPKNNSHRQVVLGLDIQNQPSASTTIGWSETSLLNPTGDVSEDTPSSTSSFQFPFAWKWHDSKGTTHTLGWALTRPPSPNPSCHFIHIKRNGASVGYDQAHRGFTFGSFDGTALRANPNLNASYHLSYQSSNKGINKLTTLTKKINE